MFIYLTTELHEAKTDRIQRRNRQTHNKRSRFKHPTVVKSSWAAIKLVWNGPRVSRYTDCDQNKSVVHDFDFYTQRCHGIINHLAL